MNSSPAPVRSLLVIPGVGDQRPGEVLDNLQKAGVDGTRSRETVGGRDFETIDAPGNIPYHRVYELNWSDLSPPGRGFFDMPRFLLTLVFVLLRVGANPPQARGGWVIFPRLYRIWFETVFVWTMLIPIFLLVHDVVSMRHTASVMLGFIFVVFVFRFLQVARNSVPLAVGAIVWLFGFGALLVFIDHLWTIPLATVVFLTGLIGTVVLAFLASVEVLLNRRAARFRNGRIAWLGMMHVPFATVSGFYGFLMGAIAWFSGDGKIFIGSVVDNEILDPRVGECLMIAYSLTVFVLGMAVWAVYWASRKTVGRPYALFQNGVALIFGVSATVLLAGGVLFLLQGRDLLPPLLPQLFPAGDKAAWAATTAFAYKLSAGRILAVMPFVFLSPFRQTLDRIGDVLLYILPDHDSRATRRTILRRLQALQTHLAAKGEPYDVVAHSQGSVIARDGIDFTGRSVLTLSAPLDSLYERFLGFAYLLPLGSGFQWVNRFRPDDVLAGPVADALDDAFLSDGRRGHENYFSSPEVFALVARMGAGVRGGDGPS